MASILRGSRIRLAAQGFHALFLKGAGSAKPFYPTLSMRVDSAGPQEVHQIEASFPTIREWIGPRQASAIKFFEQTIVNKKYEGTLEIPREAYDDDILGSFNRQARLLGVQAVLQPDQLAKTLLVNGFTANCWDTKKFFAANHPTKDGTNDNVMTGGAAALSADNFEAARAKLRKMKEWNGEPIDYEAMGMTLRLIVAPNLEGTAKRIVAAETTSSGATNVNYKAAEPAVWSRLPDNYWYLAAGSADQTMAPLIFQSRDEPELVSKVNIGDDIVFTNDVVQHGVRGRWAMGYGWYQFIVGSTGS